MTITYIKFVAHICNKVVQDVFILIPFNIPNIECYIRVISHKSAKLISAEMTGAKMSNQINTLYINPLSNHSIVIAYADLSCSPPPLM